MSNEDVNINWYAKKNYLSIKRGAKCGSPLVLPAFYEI
jgi:hypothetical protein